MIDCHCHLLPGIDDGPETLEEAIVMARMLQEQGFAEVHCTPHCIHGLYENTPAIVRSRLISLQKALDQARIPLWLKPGMEYYLDSHFPEQLRDLQPLGNTRFLLVEAPTWAVREMVLDNLRRIVAAGYVPLLAHPERWSLLSPPEPMEGPWRKVRGLFRSAEEQHSADLFDRLQGMGCLFQGNLGSFVGRYGREVEKRALIFLKAGLYSCLGSDSHPRPGLEEMVSMGIRTLYRLTDQHQSLLWATRLTEFSGAGLVDGGLSLIHQ